MDINTSILNSWKTKESEINTINDITSWITDKNNTTHVNINRITLSDNGFWFYDKDKGEITNKNNIFFKIKGLQKRLKGEILLEQPIIIQNEIGYLGIICKELDGVMHFLMQAKVEPGNINKVQISPTIQATKSNFTQKHGGKRPEYLDYFINASKYEIIVDQLQSEQSSRFYKKRNRNIIIKVDEDIEVLQSYKWMTLGQIKELLKIDNLVNMDTRTVLSCIPFYRFVYISESMFRDKSLYRSIYNQELVNGPDIYHYINNYKMFDETETQLVPLSSLTSWHMSGGEFICKDKYDFKVIFCDIEIDGREVKRWVQPLFEAIGKAMFGLMTCQDNGIRKFLIKATPEVGCFDKIEFGPSIQFEPSDSFKQTDEVIDLFLHELELKSNIKYDVILSEEGGRFYREENRNIIIEIKKSVIKCLPEGYFWVDYKTLNQLIQINNCLNIQLRNLLSLLEV